MENISADPSAFAYLTTFLPLFFMLAVSVALGFIPAYLARKKGYSCGLFWLFGFFLFLPALIVACCIEDKTKPKPPAAVYVAQPYAPPAAPDDRTPNSPVDGLQRCKALLDQGALTEEEYDAVKTKLPDRI